MHRCRRGAGDREVHRRTCRRRCVYRQHDLLGHGVDPSRPRLRLASASLTANSTTRMTSETKRDPRADHLITPENAALLVIDYQPAQVATVRSMDQKLLMKNVV